MLSYLPYSLEKIIVLKGGGGGAKEEKTDEIHVCNVNLTTLSMIPQNLAAIRKLA